MLTLTDEEQALLAGAHGPGTQMAMSILVEMARIYGARHLLPISGAHIDSTIYIGEAGLAFAERLAELGAQISVPATVNVSGLDEHNWQDWPVPQQWAQNAHRQMVAYQQMGCIPTWTCAPYQLASRPGFGQQIAWGESNAIAFANSVLGARTERYPDLLDICCAITGRAPAVGLHLPENRAGHLHFRLVDIPLAVQQDDTFYPVLGHLLGHIAQDRIPVVSGLQAQPNEDQLKALGAAAASSGTVALFHLVGITPEAATLEDAFQDRPPAETIDVTLPHLRAARQELTTADGQQLDMVVLGSPHFSLTEFAQLTPLLAGRQKHPDVEFLVTSSRAMALLAKQAGHLAALTAFGGRVTLDTCILATPMLPPRVKTLMTNSAKYAYYAPGLLNTTVTFGSLADCVNSAETGRVVRDHALWGDGPATPLVVPRATDPRPVLAGTPSLTRPQTIPGRAIIPGEVQATALVSPEPLSFWGGYDHQTGEITDRRHPLSGVNAAGRILAVPFTRGSSTTTAVLLEAVRAGTAPAAILTTHVDSFFALASIVADVLYARPVPLIVISPAQFATLQTGDMLHISPGGQITLLADEP